MTHRDSTATTTTHSSMYSDDGRDVASIPAVNVTRPSTWTLMPAGGTGGGGLTVVSSGGGFSYSASNSTSRRASHITGAGGHRLSIMQRGSMLPSNGMLSNAGSSNNLRTGKRMSLAHALHASSSRSRLGSMIADPMNASGDCHRCIRLKDGWIKLKRDFPQFEMCAPITTHPGPGNSPTPSASSAAVAGGGGAEGAPPPVQTMTVDQAKGQIVRGLGEVPAETLRMMLAELVALTLPGVQHSGHGPTTVLGLGPGGPERDSFNESGSGSDAGVLDMMGLGLSPAGVARDPHSTATMNNFKFGYGASRRESTCSHLSVASTIGRQDVKATANLFKNAQDEDGTLELNQYLLLEELGQGTQGTVYLAFDQEQQDFRAIKEVKRPLPRSSELDQLRAEISIMKRLRHRNIIALYEVIDDPAIRRLYLVLQYADKGALIQYTNADRTRCEPMDQGEFINVARQLTAGLAYLHDHEILHRDIKPDNVLRGRDDQIFLADFGVSQMLDDVAAAVDRAESDSGSEMHVSRGYSNLSLPAPTGSSGNLAAPSLNSSVCPTPDSRPRSADSHKNLAGDGRLSRQGSSGVMDPVTAHPVKGMPITTTIVTTEALLRPSSAGSAIRGANSQPFSSLTNSPRNGSETPLGGRSPQGGPLMRPAQRGGMTSSQSSSVGMQAYHQSTRGTPAFFAPEILGGALDETVDGKAVDIWALGITFYMLLCGCLPFGEPHQAFTGANSPYRHSPEPYALRPPTEVNQASSARAGTATDARSKVSILTPQSSALASNIPILSRTTSTVASENGGFCGSPTGLDWKKYRLNVLHKEVEFPASLSQPWVNLLSKMLAKQPSKRLSLLQVRQTIKKIKIIDVIGRRSEALGNTTSGLARGASDLSAVKKAMVTVPGATAGGTGMLPGTSSMRVVESPPIKTELELEADSSATGGGSSSSDSDTQNQSDSNAHLKVGSGRGRRRGGGGPPNRSASTSTMMGEDDAITSPPDFPSLIVGDLDTHQPVDASLLAAGRSPQRLRVAVAHAQRHSGVFNLDGTGNLPTPPSPHIVPHRGEVDASLPVPVMDNSLSASADPSRSNSIHVVVPVSSTSAIVGGTPARRSYASELGVPDSVLDGAFTPVRETAPLLPLPPLPSHPMMTSHPAEGQSESITSFSLNNSRANSIAGANFSATSSVGGVSPKTKQASVQFPTSSHDAQNPAPAPPGGH